jgi:hypothetical protein
MYMIVILGTLASSSGRGLVRLLLLTILQQPIKSLSMHLYRHKSRAHIWKEKISIWAPNH